MMLVDVYNKKKGGELSKIFNKLPSSNNNFPQSPQDLPGCNDRFCPTDEELMTFYLKNIVLLQPLPPHNFTTYNIYMRSPQDLSAKFHRPGERIMYFFTWHTYIRSRLNRVAGNGYWKEIGCNDIDIQIGSKENPIGYKKTLVYYQFQGNYSKEDAIKSVFYQYQLQYQGVYPEKDVIKTNWIMHEYRMNDQHILPVPHTQREANLMKNNKWLLCKIYRQETEFENRDELDTNVCSINTDMDTGSSGISILNPSTSSKRGEIECNCWAALCLICKKLRLGCADEEDDAFIQMEKSLIAKL